MADDQDITYTEIPSDPTARDADVADSVRAVVELYDVFGARGQIQGLPPAGCEARQAWVRGLFDAGENFLAWQGGKVVGHCCLIVDPRRQDAEYLIFVHPDFWRQGIGTELTRRSIQQARQLALECVWLTVEALNFRAIRLYRKSGFLFCDTGERERTMILKL